MKISGVLTSLAVMATLCGCGSDGDGGDAAKEFAQNIDNVPYNLNRLEISANLGSATNGNAEQLRRIIGEAGRAKDKVQRIIKGANFVLVVNGKESGVQVSSAGNIDHKQNISENSPGCSLSGTSQVGGVATSLKVEINWNFQATLQGESCDANMIAKYFKFQASEIEMFHIDSVPALLASADLANDAQRSIRLQLRLSGESH